MEGDQEKKVTFKDEVDTTETNSEPKKLLTAKAKYVWKDKGDSYFLRNKIVRSVDKNINLMAITSEDNKKNTIILNPRFITLNPFSNEENILVVSDILDIDGNNLNSDVRSGLLNFVKDKKDVIEADEVKFLYQFRIKVDLDNLDLILDDILNLLLKARLTICNYYIDDEKNLVFDSEFLNPILCGDEAYMFKYVISNYFNVLSKNNKISINYEVSRLDFYCMNIHTNKDNGIENLLKYKEKFGDEFIISDSTEKFKKGHFIVKSDVSKCHFGSINNILEKILEDRVSNDI